MTRKMSRKSMRGGTWNGPSAPARVGCSWNGDNVNRWPGVAGFQGQTNHLELSKNGVSAGAATLPVSTSNMMMGGRRTRRHGKCKGKKKNKSFRRRASKRMHRRKNKSSRRSNKRSRRHRRTRGGGDCGCTPHMGMTGGSGLVRGRLFPAQLVNAYRSVMHAPTKFINTWGGLQQPANLTATPTYQPALDDQKMPRMAVGSKIPTSSMSTATGTVAM